MKAWLKAHPERAKELRRQSARRTRPTENARKRTYTNSRRKVDVNFRLKSVCRSRLQHALAGTVKSASTTQLLGCTIPELKRHLEARFRPGMTWENYGPVWHVDHRIPCARFDLSDPAQQRECFHYMNLQPLFAEENLSKGAR